MACLTVPSTVTHVFLLLCNEQGYTKTNLKIYKTAETVKETYIDDELMTLLKKPETDCKFCEYRNWVIVNFLLNSGCRAATVRNTQNQDVDLSRKQIVLRHMKNSKVQIIPLCTATGCIMKIHKRSESNALSKLPFKTAESRGYVNDGTQLCSEITLDSL